MTRKPAKQITKREIAAIHNFYSLAADKGPVNVPAARAPRVAKPRTEPSEAEILKAIMALLKRHPKVAKVWRVNSGVAQYQYGAKTSYVRFNTAKGMSDIMGLLKTGRTFAIEVKARKGIVHEHQQQFLDDINAGGGLAFVARSVDDVIAKLGG